MYAYALEVFQRGQGDHGRPARGGMDRNLALSPAAWACGLGQQPRWSPRQCPVMPYANHGCSVPRKMVGGMCFSSCSRPSPKFRRARACMMAARAFANGVGTCVTRAVRVQDALFMQWRTKAEKRSFGAACHGGCAVTSVSDFPSATRGVVQCSRFL